MFLLLFVGMGMLTAAIAKKRGRNPVSWGIFGSLFFIIAIPWLLLLPSRAPAINIGTGATLPIGYALVPISSLALQPAAPADIPRDAYGEPLQ